MHRIKTERKMSINVKTNQTSMNSLEKTKAKEYFVPAKNEEICLKFRNTGEADLCAVENGIWVLDLFR